MLHSGIRNMPGLIHWLTSRQFAYLDPNSYPIVTDNQGDDGADEAVNFLLPKRLADLSISENLRHVACNGRCNKVADTCYSWWVAAALANLGRTDLIDWKSARRFLLDKMAHHVVGGFSKHPGGPPDVYHGCFGLAALAIMGEPGLNQVDSVLAVPVYTVRVIEKARAALVRRAMEEGKASLLTREAIQMGLAMRGGGTPAWLVAVGGYFGS
jgi:geranylgeranyl transferase type-1 subunit beta